MKKNTAIALTAAAAIVAAGAIYSAVIMSMSGKLAGGVRINGINCGFMTYQEAAQALTEDIGAREVLLTRGDEELDTIDVSDYAALSFTDSTMQKINDGTGAMERLFFFLMRSEYTLEPEIVIDEDAVEALTKEVGGDEAPQNAYITRDAATGEFSIVEETKGDMLDAVTASAMIKGAILDNLSELDMTDAFVKAGVLSDNEELAEKLVSLNSDFGFTVKIVVKNGVSTKTSVLKDEELFDMYSLDANGVPYYDEYGNYEVDEKKASEYIESVIPEDWRCGSQASSTESEDEEGASIGTSGKARDDVVKEQTAWLVSALKTCQDAISTISYDG